MVRLKDLAQQIGVSVMTVSKALRDEPDVSATTRARIKALARQMGYVPDSSAQGLRTGHHVTDSQPGPTQCESSLTLHRTAPILRASMSGEREPDGCPLIPRGSSMGQGPARRPPVDAWRKRRVVRVGSNQRCRPGSAR